MFLQKAENWGLRGPMLALLKSHMTNRSQVVKIGSEISKLKTSQGVVPRDSALGPLLLILKTNDLPTIASSVKTYLYADDTTRKQTQQL